jgi:hypothetical protein
MVQVLGTDVHSCTAVDKSVQVIVLLEVHRVFDQECFQVPDLVVGNILCIISLVSYVL